MRRFLMGAALAAMAVGNVGTAVAQTAPGVSTNQAALGLSGSRAGARTEESNGAVGSLLTIALTALSVIVTVAVVVAADDDDEDDGGTLPTSP